jgi:hypothetical protein
LLNGCDPAFNCLGGFEETWPGSTKSLVFHASFVN